ncbi:MAG: tRNA (adenosine(37)-N6)-threonylcarbamoyltransferase complex ATPase subunit type 1 TsaE [Alistipes sp.]|nr:tRNA (adenosine(37)-N6)-threonylcarbamoyltransferase complex ATPase subunit type 1 TsaE [Candidatus Alistipes equi]
MKRVFQIQDVDDLSKVAKAIVEELSGRNVIAFHGTMGAGKTTLISALLGFLESHDTVTSPTFAIVNEYHSSLFPRIYHFDFYRINKLSEALDIGTEEYFSSGDLCLVEWPERIEELLPYDTMVVEIRVISSIEREIILDYSIE